MGKQGWFRVVIGILTVTLMAGVLPAFAGNQTVFGPTDFSIGKWHLHLSRHTFDAPQAGDGVLHVRKITPNRHIDKGLIIFNRKLISLRQFLNGSTADYKKDIKLQASNNFAVFLYGTPGASIQIEIQAHPGDTPPEIITFTANPPSIQTTMS